MQLQFFFLPQGSHCSPGTPNRALALPHRGLVRPLSRALALPHRGLVRPLNRAQALPHRGLVRPLKRAVPLPHRGLVRPLNRALPLPHRGLVRPLNRALPLPHRGLVRPLSRALALPHRGLVRPLNRALALPHRGLVRPLNRALALPHRGLVRPLDPQIAGSRDQSLLVEYRTRGRKVASSNSGRSGGTMFFSRVNFVCWPLFVVRSTPVLLKRPRSFWQKYRWRVIPKRAYTLHSMKSEWADYAAVQMWCGNIRKRARTQLAMEHLATVISAL